MGVVRFNKDTISQNGNAAVMMRRSIVDQSLGHGPVIVLTLLAGLGIEREYIVGGRNKYGAVHIHGRTFQ